MAFCKLSLSFFYDLLQGQDSSEVFHQKFEKISRNIFAQISLYVLLMLTMLQWPPPHGMGHSSSAAPPLGSLCGGVGGAEIESLNLPKNSAVVACFASPARSLARALPSAFRVRIASSMRTPHPARSLLRSPPTDRHTSLYRDARSFSSRERR